MSERKRVAIVEDDFLIATYLRDLCELDIGAEVVGVANTADEASKLLRETRPDWVLMDVRLGGKRDGVDVAKEIYELNPQTKVIYVTGSNEPSTIERINSDHPYKILIKPVSPAELRAALR